MAIRIDRAKLDRMLAGRGGLVDRDLRKRAARVVTAARAGAPGSMARKITEPKIGRNGRGLTATITSQHPATLFVVNGTRPHQIRPVRTKALRFTISGRVVYAKLVAHPGTKPNPFLQKALRSAL